MEAVSINLSGFTGLVGKTFCCLNGLDMSQCVTKEYSKDSIVYHSWPNEGISLETCKGALCNIHVFINDKRYRSFSGTLPYGLSNATTNDQLVSFLGEPSKKSGGKVVNIVLEYAHLGRRE